MEQINEIQNNVASILELITARIERKVRRSINVTKVNGNKPELVHRDLNDILTLDLNELKNLASDLKKDARI